MRTTLKKTVKHTRKIYGQYISNELHNSKVGCIEKIQHKKDVLGHHKHMVALREKIYMPIQDVKKYKGKVLIGTAATYADAAISLAELQIR